MKKEKIREVRMNDAQALDLIFKNKKPCGKQISPKAMNPYIKHQNPHCHDFNGHLKLKSAYREMT